MVNSYSKAGVDVKKAEGALLTVKNLIQSTHKGQVISVENGFAALYLLDNGLVLASATDGVGTKLEIAIEMNKHSSIGIDLVAMVVNDLAVYGIQPLFFLDYLATSKLEPDIFTHIVEGIVNGCKQAGCALIGGETAEMPGFYPDKKYDLAGFAVGAANKNDLITGEHISSGDVVIGLASSGLHSNGYSLARKIIKENKLSLNMAFSDSTLGEILLKPTVIYTAFVQKAKGSIAIKGLAHITGGGFWNIARVLPDNVKVMIQRDSWPIPPIYDYLKEEGNLEEQEMYDIFNMGIGMVAIVKEAEAQNIIEIAKQNDINAFIIGNIKSGNKKVIVS